jgi:hypothetical protein
MPFPLPSKLLRGALIESAHAVFVHLAVRYHHHLFVVRLVPRDGYIYILSVFDEIVAEDVRADLGYRATVAVAARARWELPGSCGHCRRRPQATLSSLS